MLSGVLAVALAVGGALHHLSGRDQFMAINVRLAMAPVLLAVLLFLVRPRGVLWWLGTGLLLLLLPNTPYVLTDVVHLRDSLVAARAAGGSGATTAATYVALFTIGFVGYTLVLALIAADLRRRHRRRLIGPVLLALNAACAVGVWLGRVARLNSWDAAYPWKVVGALASASHPRAGAAILVVFVVVGTATLVLLRMTDRAARRLGPAWLRRRQPPLPPH